MKHLKIFEEFVNESVNDYPIFKAVIMAGSPAAGKSFLVEKMFKGTNAVVIEGDKFLEYFLKQVGLSSVFNMDDVETYAKQSEIRAHAKELTKQKLYHAIDGMLCLVIDGTGHHLDKVIDQKRGLEHMGYDVHMIFVETTLEVARARNKQRARQIPEPVLVSSWTDATENVPAFKREFGESFHLIEHNRDNSDLKADQKLARHIMDSPLRNEIGIATIERLKKDGKKYLHELTPMDTIKKIRA